MNGAIFYVSKVKIEFFKAIAVYPTIYLKKVSDAAVVGAVNEIFMTGMFPINITKNSV